MKRAPSRRRTQVRLLGLRDDCMKERTSRASHVVCANTHTAIADWLSCVQIWPVCGGVGCSQSGRAEHAELPPTGNTNGSHRPRTFDVPPGNRGYTFLLFGHAIKLVRPTRGCALTSRDSGITRAGLNGYTASVNLRMRTGRRHRQDKYQQADDADAHVRLPP
jgi:hypothetical protein